jgi:hypothetical protein
MKAGPRNARWARHETARPSGTISLDAMLPSRASSPGFPVGDSPTARGAGVRGHQDSKRSNTRPFTRRGEFACLLAGLSAAANRVTSLQGEDFINHWQRRVRAAPGVGMNGPMREPVPALAGSPCLIRLAD